jgi:glutathionyl-hydroquinone reductase
VDLQLLADRPYLTGDTITEADWRVLPTLLRFDAVYHTHFRCNGRRLIEYPNLIRYTTDLFNQPHVAQTFALDEINPKRIIPAGPLGLGFTSA